MVDTLTSKNEIQDIEMSKEITERLCTACSIWSELFLSQALIFQTPRIYPSENTTYYGYGSNSTGFLPKYSIEQIILTEINLRVLDKLESIKYSLYYTNATSALADIWLANRDKGYFLHDLKYVSESYRKNNLDTIKTYEPGKCYRHEKKFTIKASANGYTKKLINTFYLDNSEFMSKCDCFKKNNQMLIPLYNTPVLCNKFILTKKQNLQKALDINALDNVWFNKGAIYWQYYRNTKLLDLEKERRIEYYRRLFSNPILLKALYAITFPEMENINQIQNLIDDIFFNKDIITKYKECALPDYLIMVYHFLINTTLNDLSPKYKFVSNAQNLKSNIEKIMDIETIINSMVDEKFNRLMREHNNVIDMVESDLVTQLTGYVDFENYYNVTS